MCSRSACPPGVSSGARAVCGAAAEAALKVSAMAARAIGGNLAKTLREIRLQFCQTGRDSLGARQFVEQYYVPLKKANPEFPILIRECSGVQPKLWARYAFGKERSVALDNMSAEQVAKELEKVINLKP
ncbi:NADH dehydrogenase [ubiquinone] 1 alpha subcomplex subunit 2 isoform X2 [Pygocentrus nattereri]|uniref:NADH dehydrogenase [ubiquinone] 1 alpha subcomplex subunit 2 isoform X2 n=1 Tax=Pygocentrus nattereri TaxID=42514 RepID=UPI001891E2EA|nr:NADH dehydrogenase [ubiquinone] 1 alpha subcomplex subunit 2 isoform X2 [Pygocentrus nattereri]